MKEFYQGKRVLVTGHTGFKGTWLVKMLTMLGAEVVGYSLEPSCEEHSLYKKANMDKEIKSIYGDIRDYSSLMAVFDKYDPEIVFHLAAQPIVKTGYESPKYTYEVNTMGTVNILECIRNSKSTRSVVNVTTDKVYHNNEWVWGYRETDALDGFDPYANSKSCSELVTSTYCRSFFYDSEIKVSTARAGNVIGGGDFADARIIPDCYRAIMNNNPIKLRHPKSIRPYQYVLEALHAYLLIAMSQYNDKKLAGSYNIGPKEESIITTFDLVSKFSNAWDNKLLIEVEEINEFHESKILKLDSSKITSCTNWSSVYDIDMAIMDTVYFYREMSLGADVNQLLKKCIDKHFDFYMKKVI